MIASVMASPRIRLAAMADVSALPRIEAAAARLFIGTHAESVATGPTTAINTLLRARRAGLLWVADHQGAVSGFLFGERCPEGLYLQEMSVAPEAQRQGIGKALMQTAIDHGRANGAAAILLTTDRILPWNAPFYARLGFAIIEGAAMPKTLRQRLDHQSAHGMDAAHRCAMVLSCKLTPNRL